MTPAATRALDLVRRAGVAHQVHLYASPERHGRGRDDRPAYGADVSAGRRGLQLELSPADLLALSGAVRAVIARDHRQG